MSVDRFDSELVRAWLRAAAESIHARRDELTQLDATIGDADHGANMDRGFGAAAESVEALAELPPPGELLILAGETIMSAVGGASGALWGTAFRRAGQALGMELAPGCVELAWAFEAALDGVVEIGAASEGEKTMVDALAPAARTLRAQAEAGAALAPALAATAAAGEAGMQATVPLQARKGRASYLGERSIGHQDPGATSTVLILAALQAAASDER